MGKILKIMCNELPETLMGFYIFLATMLAIFSGNYSAAIQAVFFASLVEMAQVE